jgi:phospholipase/carboxylesterase
MRDVTGGTGPHAGQPIARAGAPLGDAVGALILVHGRGGDAGEMLGLAGLVAPPALACLAPQAAGNTWYPYRFTEPVARNEPYLSSALSALGALVDRLVGDGVPAERTRPVRLLAGRLPRPRVRLTPCAALRGRHRLQWWPDR